MSSVIKISIQNLSAVTLTDNCLFGEWKPARNAPSVTLVIFCSWEKKRLQIWTEAKHSQKNSPFKRVLPVAEMSARRSLLVVSAICEKKQILWPELWVNKPFYQITQSRMGHEGSQFTRSTTLLPDTTLIRNNGFTRVSQNNNAYWCAVKWIALEI